MIVIGEKINGAIPKTAQAIEERDTAYIANLAVAQTEAGADYLDVCAGTLPEVEYEALCWLIDVVQEATDTPICIDSPNPEMIARVFPRVNKQGAKPGIINSISLEGSKCEVLLPLLAENPEWQTIALCCDNNGLSETPEAKFELAKQLVEKAAEYGVGPERLHIDPLVLAISAVQMGAVNFLEAMKLIKNAYPTAHIAAAVSNVSFGMPLRGIINRNFLPLCMAAGLDTAIVDPTTRSIYEAIVATNALLGNDRCCRKYNNAYRAGKIGSQKK